MRHETDHHAQYAMINARDTDAADDVNAAPVYVVVEHAHYGELQQAFLPVVKAVTRKDHGHVNVVNCGTCQPY